MARELILAAFIMAVGLAVAGAGTYLYQGLHKQQAMLRFDGATVLHMAGNLVMSFFCGPFIMLQLGWRQEGQGTAALASVLVSSLVAFGWAFITGLIIMGSYVSILSNFH